MRRLLVRGPLVGLHAVLLLLDARSAGALVQWCRTDPVVEIGGERMHVYVSGPADLLGAVTGPTVVEITVPIGVPVSLVSTDSGFGLGWDVRFAESDRLRVADQGIEVRIRTRVPADTHRLVVVTEVTDGNGGLLATMTGATNTGDTAKAWL